MLVIILFSYIQVYHVFYPSAPPSTVGPHSAHTLISIAHTVPTRSHCCLAFLLFVPTRSHYCLGLSSKHVFRRCLSMHESIIKLLRAEGSIQTNRTTRNKGLSRQKIAFPKSSRLYLRFSALARQSRSYERVLFKAN